jgi:hypothetical protein
MMQQPTSRRSRCRATSNARSTRRYTAFVAEVNRTVPGAFFKLLARFAVLCGGFVQCTHAEASLEAHLIEHGDCLGVRDALAIFAQDGEGFAVDVAARSELRVVAHPRVRGVLRHVGVHLASAMRLRRKLPSRPAPSRRR